MALKQKALSLWNELNPRQQKYLELIYQVDQASEYAAKQSWFKGGDRRPASEWRWMFYGDINFMESRLKDLLRSAGYVDPGTGSTFNALKSRRLIECDGEAPELNIKMTRLGRQVIRAGTNELVVRIRRTPKGMLSQNAWHALTIAYQGRKDGLTPSKDDSYHYLQGIHDSVWYRLADHNPPLFNPPNHCRPTACGTIFYLRNHQRYREVYPDIDAPLPSETEAEVINQLKAPQGDKSALARVKRWKRGLKEVAAEIGDIDPFDLLRFEKGQFVEPEQKAQILNWLKQ